MLPVRFAHGVKAMKAMKAMKEKENEDILFTRSRTPPRRSGAPQTEDEAVKTAKRNWEAGGERIRRKRAKPALASPSEEQTVSWPHFLFGRVLQLEAKVASMGALPQDREPLERTADKVKSSMDANMPRVGELLERAADNVKSSMDAMPQGGELLERVADYVKSSMDAMPQNDYSDEGQEDEASSLKTVCAQDADFIALFDKMLENSQKYRSFEAVRNLCRTVGCSFTDDDAYIEGTCLGNEEWFECSLIDDEFFENLSEDEWRLDSEITRDTAMDMFVKRLNEQLISTEQTFRQYEVSPLR